jgi:hypothetical protein
MAPGRHPGRPSLARLNRMDRLEVMAKFFCLCADPDCQCRARVSRANVLCRRCMDGEHHYSELENALETPGEPEASAR